MSGNSQSRMLPNKLCIVFFTEQPVTYDYLYQYEKCAEANVEKFEEKSYNHSNSRSHANNVQVKPGNIIQL